MTDAKYRDDVPGQPPARGNLRHRLRGLLVTGAIATLAATVATTVTGAVAKGVGVDFELPDGGQTMPLTGIAMMTGIISVLGVGIAAGFLRWSLRPAERFVKVAVTLTGISLIPPFLAEANAATVTALLLIHLVAAAVMIPALGSKLRN